MKLKTLTMALLVAAGASQALSPVETYGSLAVKGSKLVSVAKDSAAVTLRGMSLFWHYDNGGKEFWNASVVSYVQTDWHNAIIRAPIGVEDHAISGGLTAKGYISSPTDAMNKIHTIIDAAILYGSYVIVDWHTHNAQTTSAKVFFETLAKEYGNTPNIIWEIFNEPTDGQALNHAKQIIPIIRKYSNNVIIVGSSSWSANPQEFGSDLDSYKNIAYTIHFYSDHNFWGRIGEANAKGHAVFASEWGMSSSSGNGGFQSTSTGNIATWLSTMENAGVSYCNWSLSNVTVNGAGVTEETSAALKIGVVQAPKDDGSAANEWSDASLTESGKSIRAWLRSKNTAWTLSDTATKLTTAFAITSSKKTDFGYGKDSIAFGGLYNKSVNWTITEKGRTSGAVLTTAGVGSSINVAHLIGMRNSGSAIWKSEVVDVTLMPLNKTLSYAVVVSSGVTPRVVPFHENNIAWDGAHIKLEHGLISEGTSVVAVLRNARGQTVWSARAVVDAGGYVRVGERPSIAGVLVLDVASGTTIVRSRLAPEL